MLFESPRSVYLEVQIFDAGPDTDGGTVHHYGRLGFGGIPQMRPCMNMASVFYGDTLSPKERIACHPFHRKVRPLSILSPSPRSSEHQYIIYVADHGAPEG